MIIVRLRGQLGNQMFEYANGYAFSKRSGDDLAIHKFDYDLTGRKYGLDSLKLDPVYNYKKIPLRLFVDSIRCRLNIKGGYIQMIMKCLKRE